MENRAITKELSRSVEVAGEVASTESELYKTGLIATSAFAGLIGVWGLLSLASALFNAEGPVALVKGLFFAVTGV